MQSDWLREFSLITWENDVSKTCNFFRIIKRTMVHHVNPKIEHQWNIFFSSKHPTFKEYFRLFPQNKFFFWLCYCFIHKKPKPDMGFHEIPIRCFWEKVVLANWLTGWQWCFHETPFPFYDKDSTISIT